MTVCMLESLQSHYEDCPSKAHARHEDATYQYHQSHEHQHLCQPSLFHLGTNPLFNIRGLGGVSVNSSLGRMNMIFLNILICEARQL